MMNELKNRGKSELVICVLGVQDNGDNFSYENKHISTIKIADATEHTSFGADF